jgi:hypothetical protein
LRWALIGLLLLHGLIHLTGFAKAFGYAELPQLTQPISREWGLVWLLAGGLVVATAVMLAADARPYWIVGALALLVSQVLIMTAWRDAWAGTAANAVLLLVVVHGLLTEGPWSFHAQYLRDAKAGLARSVDAPLVTEADLNALPEPVRRYLRVTVRWGSRACRTTASASPDASGAGQMRRGCPSMRSNRASRMNRRACS